MIVYEEEDISLLSVSSFFIISYKFFKKNQKIIILELVHFKSFRYSDGEQPFCL